MKTLLTGATGFLGGWLVSDLLDHSFEITVIRNPKSKASYRTDSQYFLKNFTEKCREEFIDLFDYSAVEKIIKEVKPDAVIHMAAVGDVTVAKNNPKYTYEVSSNGTLNILEAIRVHSPDTLFLSHTTDKVYSGNAVPFNEEMLFDPNHIYEAAKVSQEYLTKIYSESYGIRAATMRCGNYFGGYDFNFNRIVPYVIKCAIENETVQLRSDGSFTRDFLYIKDAVSINRMLLELMSGTSSPFKFGDAFNFSLEIELSVMDIVHKILELCDSKIEVQVIGDGASEIPNMRLDCTKSKTELGWLPKYSLEDGLYETIESYRSYLS